MGRTNSEITFDSFDDFPAVWSEHVLYVATDTNVMYLRSGIQYEETPSSVKIINIAINKVADNITIPIIDSSSSLFQQWPTATDTPHVVTFWPAEWTISDPVQVLSDGTIQVNEAWNYALRIRAELTRSGTWGVVDMLFRTTFNNVQVWKTTTQKLESRNVLIALDSYIPAVLWTWDLRLEIMRDSNGANDWFLESFTPADTGWTSTACASIQVFKIDSLL